MKVGAWLILAALAAPRATRSQDMVSPHRVMTLACEKCHQASAWKQVKFAHQETRFALEARHAEVSCRQCHDLADFSKATPRCDGCHADVHQGKQTRDCGRCHSPAGWRIIDVNQAHETTMFPLAGKHAVIDCGNCHRAQQQGDFFGLTAECLACHAQDLQMAMDPDHRAMGFPTDCGSCHQWLAWTPASFAAHDAFFPINSGNHAGVWSSCTTCHTAGSNYREFSCFLGCHEHEQSAMDRQHREVRNYQYNSQACYGCHPNGQGDD